MFWLFLFVALLLLVFCSKAVLRNLAVSATVALGMLAVLVCFALFGFWAVLVLSLPVGLGAILFIAEMYDQAQRAKQ